MNKKLFECHAVATATILVTADNEEEANEIALALVHSGNYNPVPDDGWQLTDETEEVEGE